MGYSVADTSGVGCGFPDLCIGRHGITALVELKTPRGRKAAQDRLGAAQIEFKGQWKGSPVIVAYTTAEIVYDFSLIAKRLGWGR